jgi:hypothetical protein
MDDDGIRATDGRKGVRRQMQSNQLGDASWDVWYCSETQILCGLMGEYYSWTGISFWPLLRLACPFSAPPLAINRKLSDRNVKHFDSCPYDRDCVCFVSLASKDSPA